MGVGVALLLGSSSLASQACAGEFYSWIGPSGEMVLTDDAGNIPPAGKRGPVSVHQFRDAPPPAPVSTRAAGGIHQRSGSEIEAFPASEALPQPLWWMPDGAETADPAASDLPTVLLDRPDQAVAPQYGWVPLSSPMYLWSTPVYGFWARHAVPSPSAAFQHYLQQLQAMMPRAGSPAANPGGTTSGSPNGWQRHTGSSAYPVRWTGPASLHSRAAGSPVVWRERQAIIARPVMSGRSADQPSAMHSPTSPPSCCASNHVQGSGRRSGSRR